MRRESRKTKNKKQKTNNNSNHNDNRHNTTQYKNNNNNNNNTIKSKIKNNDGCNNDCNHNHNINNNLQLSTITQNLHQFQPKLYRVNNQKYFYIRLNSAFTDNTNQFISLHITTGKSYTNNHTFLHTFKHSIFLIDQQILNFENAWKIISNRHFSGTIETLPIQKMTRDYTLMYKIYNNKNKPHLLSTLAPHYTIHDWLNLFFRMSQFENRHIARTVRQLIRNFLFSQYQFTTKQINNGINLNVTIYYHHLTNKHHIRNCQQLIIQSHIANTPTIKQLLPQKVYTTFKRNPTTAQSIVNYKTITDSYDPNTPPKCCQSTHCKNNTHMLLLPSDLPLNIFKLFRNLNTPHSLSNFDQLHDITQALIKLTRRLSHVITSHPQQIQLTQNYTDNTTITLNNYTTTIHNSRLDCLLHHYHHYSITPYNTHNFIHNLITASSTPQPTTNNIFPFITHLHRFGKLHEIFSHPFKFHPQTASYTMDVKPGLQSSCRAFGSLGSAFEYRWNHRSMVLQLPHNWSHEQIHDTYTWLALSLLSVPLHYSCITYAFCSTTSQRQIPTILTPFLRYTVTLRSDDTTITVLIFSHKPLASRYIACFSNNFQDLHIIKHDNPTQHHTHHFHNPHMNLYWHRAIKLSLCTRHHTVYKPSSRIYLHSFYLNTNLTNNNITIEHRINIINALTKIQPGNRD